jgi:hypothetical protein
MPQNSTPLANPAQSAPKICSGTPYHGQPQIRAAIAAIHAHARVGGVLARCKQVDLVDHVSKVGPKRPEDDRESSAAGMKMLEEFEKRR